MNKLRILAVGDVVGPCGLDYLDENLKNIKRRYSIDYCIANGENCAKYNGLQCSDAEEMYASGVDMITSGNHIWHKRDIFDYLDMKNAILRPANYPGSCPGHGWAIENVSGMRLLVINLMGVVFLDSLDSPFETADSILKAAEGKYDISVLDFHAEATSEKIALARYLDGRINIVFGTHTHVQTNDICVLPKGTAYITDIGMTGAVNSVLGVDPESSITRFITKMPVRFEPAEGKCRLSGAVFEIDAPSGNITQQFAINE